MTEERKKCCIPGYINKYRTHINPAEQILTNYNILKLNRNMKCF